MFKIVSEKKRTVKASCAGQVIEALKRAKSPLTLTALASRVKATKQGKEITVKDLKARVKKVADWYVADENAYVQKNEDGEYFLTVIEEASAVTE